MIELTTKYHEGLQLPEPPAQKQLCHIDSSRTYNTQEQRQLISKEQTA